MKKIILLAFAFFHITFFWGQQAVVTGVITNKDNQPLANVSVTYSKYGTVTNAQGEYSIQIPAQKNITLTFSHISYQTFYKILNLEVREFYTYNVTLSAKVEDIKEVEIKTKRNEVQGVTQVNIETVKNLPSANAGIEGALKLTALGTSSDNELSTQYKVRGGNYDENLVYVNGIEVYRPFLVRSGQQEGLSFLNPDLTAQVKFTSGGFQAKYGDKLSSVLDITYKKPEKFGISADLNMLGAAVSIEGVLPNQKTSAIAGLRYRDNRLLVKSQEVDVNYDPRFADVQTLISHSFNSRWTLDFLGNFSLNDYRYIPLTRTTNFGTIDEPKTLLVFYEGMENDKYLTSFGALNLQFFTHENLSFSLTSSLFNTQEDEFFDIYATYGLGTPDTDAGTDNFGQTEFYEGIGSQLNHARNSLDALITNTELKTKWKFNDNNIDIGVKYQRENIKDRLIEWEMIDSAGFSIRPPGHIPNTEPYDAFEGPIEMYQNIRAMNSTDINRMSGFVQWNRSFDLNGNKIYANIGIRTQNWSVENHSDWLWSQRMQFSFKPNWKKDFVFRLSGGKYAQPPFYKELRDASGSVVPTVKAQQSLQVVLGTDYTFALWNRPFKLVTEAYYKYLTDVNPYTLDNVRIRYAAANNAVAYAYGLDFRINGEFVPGTESWFNFGYLKTEENIDNRGYIARPSDQRLKFALLFQDYVPSMPQLKMSMNLVYNTGVPGGSPTYSDPYDYDYRLGDYKRVDLGVFYVFKDEKNASDNRWFNHFKSLSIGGEILNMFNINNAITNTWVRDVYSKRMYGIKNYMTGRVFNINLKMQL